MYTIQTLLTSSISCVGTKLIRGQMKLIKILFTRCSWSHHCAHMIEQGRDLYLSWTMVWSTDTGLGSQNVFTSFVNPSTVVDLFFHPSTSLQASSYSNWKGWMLNRFSREVFKTHNAFFAGAYLSVVWRVEQIVCLVLQLLDVQLPSLFSADEVRRVISPAHWEQTLLLLRSLECLSSLRVSLQPAPGRIKVWSLEIIFFFTILLPTVLLTKNILSYWKLF